MRNLFWLSVLLFTLLFPESTYAANRADCKVLEEIFNTKVESEKGICKVEVVREGIKATHMGQDMSPEAMELVFHLSFEQVKGGTAVMGEFALLEEEVNPVIDELRKGKLEISAVHNHMLYEQPRIMYIHFQGIGEISKEAKAIKRAMDSTSK